MNTMLVLVLLMAYAMGVVIMIIVPEGWMSKGSTPNKVLTEKGFGRKVFTLGGAIVVAIVLFISYFIS